MSDPAPRPSEPTRLARVPADLDLAGSIVVLTHPRTGSSLLMQTLRLLGAEIRGEAERPDVPREANPRGYYEHVPVLHHGLRALPLATQPTLLRGQAFKLSLSALVSRADPEEWRRLRQPAVTLLLPVRSPTESLRSQQVFLLQPKEQARRALHHVASVRSHLLDYATLARWTTAEDFGRPAPTVIDYPLALSAPAAYLDLVARSASLRPTEAQRAAAAANIDHALHRYTAARVSAEEPASARAEVLEAIYQTLRRDDADKWRQLRAQVPAWALQASDWLGTSLPAHG